MRMNRIIGGFFCVLSLLFSGTAAVCAGSPGVYCRAQEAGPVQAADVLPDFSLYATAAVLMDADSGRVLYGKNQDTALAMASTTKIMTCILVLENVSLEEELTVSAYAASMPKVKLYIQKGERYTVRDLLYSLMLESHNDSAVALAEHVGKRFLPKELGEKDAAEYTADESRQAVATFALLMNRKAAELGCENTWFITPNGLDATETIVLEEGGTLQKEHCTTAKELARIMAYCIKESDKAETFLEITRTSNYSFYANGRSFSCVNHNAFLQMMEGALTGKTGFTNKAGYCYVGALEREGRTFVVALLACGWPNNKNYKWSDTRELMQYGIDNYFYRSFSEEGVAFEESRLQPIPVHNGQTDILGATAYTKVRIEGRDTGSADAAGRAEGSKESAGGTGGSKTSAGRAGGSKESADGTEGSKTSAGRAGGSKESADGTEGSKTSADRVEGSGADAGKGAAGEGSGKWTDGLLLRKDEEIRVEHQVKSALTAPVPAGTEVGWIDYMVGDTVYKREAIVTVDTVEQIDPEWCIKRIFERFLLY